MRPVTLVSAETLLMISAIPDDLNVPLILYCPPSNSLEKLAVAIGNIPSVILYWLTCRVSAAIEGVAAPKLTREDRATAKYVRESMNGPDG